MRARALLQLYGLASGAKALASDTSRRLCFELFSAFGQQVFDRGHISQLLPSAIQSARPSYSSVSIIRVCLGSATQ